MGFVLLCCLSYCTAASFRELIDLISGLATEFSRFIVLGDFSLLDEWSEVAQEIVTIITIGYNNQLWPYLDLEVLFTVTHALDTFPIDYYNPLNMSLPLKTI